MFQASLLNLMDYFHHSKTWSLQAHFSHLLWTAALFQQTSPSRRQQTFLWFFLSVENKAPLLLHDCATCASNTWPYHPPVPHSKQPNVTSRHYRGLLAWMQRRMSASTQLKRCIFCVLLTCSWAESDGYPSVENLSDSNGSPTPSQFRKKTKPKQNRQLLSKLLHKTLETGCVQETWKLVSTCGNAWCIACAWPVQALIFHMQALWCKHVQLHTHIYSSGKKWRDYCMFSSGILI